jgi:Fur family ferric uptake transcriptional regulator/Fur family zinc uptake transcriptional regulator
MGKGSNASPLLISAGLRPTEVRTRVLSTILSSGRSLSHRELVALLVGLDRVTVYRTLKTLRQSGLVHGVQGTDGILRYFVNPRRGEGCPGNHPHFLCLECGKMSCLADQTMPYIEVPRGTEVCGKQLVIYGLCPSCAGAKAKGSVGRGEGRISA